MELPILRIHLLKKQNFDENLRIWDIQTTLKSDQSFNIFNIVNKIRISADSPSVQVAIKWHDRGSWKGCDGFANRKLKTKISNESIYEIGSITKSFTAVLIMKLFEEGHLDLNEKISKYLPDVSYGDFITIENLLYHTSGLCNYTQRIGPMFKTLLLKKKWRNTDIKKIIKTKDMVSKPGARFNYSDQNYFLLGLIIEEIAKKSFSEYLTESIIKPLGLKKTSCYTDKASSRAVSGYDSRFTPLARFGIKKEISRFQIPFKSFTFASGHIESNASDISTFYYSLYNGRILDKKSISIITKFIDADYKYPPQMTGYGLGVMRFSVDNIELWGNVGMMLGFSGVSVYSPERGYFITILANVPEVEKLFNGVAFLQKHLIERILENNRY